MAGQLAQGAGRVTATPTTECRRLLGQWISVFGLSRQVTFADTGRLEVGRGPTGARRGTLDTMDELARLRYNRAMGLLPTAGLPPTTRYDAS